MLRHGHLILVKPCEGCDPFVIGLTSFRTEGKPCWFRSGFTKRQYATRFVQVHEGVCKALDLVKEKGLLLTAKDGAEFYERRHWSRSAPIVNEVTGITRAFNDMLSAGIAAAREQGIAIEDISDPATKSYNVVRVKGDKKQGV